MRNPVIRLPARLSFINPHLLLALVLTFGFHFSLLFYSFKRTYDAYVHIFFADHYARAWFDHWEYRWYTGFTMTSYPPGSQQSIALLASGLGLQNSFIVVQLLALLLVVLGIYRFSRIWVGEEAAGYASLLAVFASSIGETVHVFGQLPTTFSLGFLLNALPYAGQWLRTGRWRHLILAWAVIAATTAGHHVTTLFGAVFFVGPVIAQVIVEKLQAPLADEPDSRRVRLSRAIWRPLIARRLRRILPVLGRVTLLGLGLIAILFIVVLPYWLWSATDPIVQVPIPHASRDSFIQNPNAGLVFWLVPYGLAALFLPYVFYQAFSARAWPLGLSLGLLFVLGTGGTTPIPRLLLRGAYDVLTLDRFTFWATIMLLPFLGVMVVSLRHGRLARHLRRSCGDPVWFGLQAGLLVAYVGFAVFTVNLTQFRRFQPEPIDMEPIAAFIEKDQHWRWRYLALGFGDQLAWLSAQTTAPTVDGNYHSARRLPELTSTPVERLEGAKYRGVPGIGSLQQFLAVPEKYHLKFVFSNDQFYDPLLYFSGWHRLRRLENGIVVWEREDIPPLPELLPRKEIPVYQRLMWGLLPMSAVFTALTAMTAGLFLSPPGRPARLSQWLWRRYQRFDRRLCQGSRLPDTAVNAAPRQWRWFIGPGRHWRRPLAALARARHAGRATPAVLLILLPLTALLVLRRPAATAEQVLAAYYEDLDFRRFEEAYARLEPGSRPSYDQFLLELSVRGGVVASYARLERLQTSALASGAGWRVIQAEADWITSLERYETRQTHELVQVDGQWAIRPPLFDPALPPDQFFRRGEVAWQSQQRRRVTTETTALGDILDRPELEILSARLVRRQGRYAVVGELINTDADPADVTVTAYLYDAQGAELAWYNAQTVLMHKLLPKEVTPFRIDFEGVAGAVLGQAPGPLDFDPTAYTGVALGQSPAQFAVHAKAVVTGRDLHRDLALQHVQVSNGVVTGELLNNGPREATIPHLLLTYYDDRGRVMWVDHAYLSPAVRPQRAQSFAVALLPPSDLTTVLIEGDLAANALPQTITLVSPWAERIPLPAATGYAALRLSIHSFVAGTG